MNYIMNRRGRFTRIFPNVNYADYKQFFEQERPYNALLAQRLMRQMVAKPLMAVESFTGDSSAAKRVLQKPVRMKSRSTRSGSSVNP